VHTPRTNKVHSEFEPLEAEMAEEHALEWQLTAIFNLDFLCPSCER
jgi:hypothetical protein